MMVSSIGINLRLDYIDEVLEKLPELCVLEIIADNWLSLGPHHKKLEKLRESYDLSFHCVGMNLGGADDIDYNYLSKIRELKDRYTPLHISDHLCFQSHAGNHHHDLLPFPFNEGNLDNVVSRVDKVQEYFGEQILIENLSYYVEYKESNMSEAEFIAKLCKKTDCNLLLDLNNIWVNSKNINVDVKEHLSLMDWSRVKEIHVAGAELFGNIYVDTHGSAIHKEVMDIVKDNRSLIQSIPVIYERDANLEGLSGMLKEVNSLSEALNGNN